MVKRICSYVALVVFSFVMVDAALAYRDLALPSRCDEAVCALHVTYLLDPGGNPIYWTDCLGGDCSPDECEKVIEIGLPERCGCGEGGELPFSACCAGFADGIDWVDLYCEAVACIDDCEKVEQDEVPLFGTGMTELCRCP